MNKEEDTFLSILFRVNLKFRLEDIRKFLPIQTPQTQKCFAWVLVLVSVYHKILNGSYAGSKVRIDFYVILQNNLTLSGHLVDSTFHVGHKEEGGRGGMEQIFNVSDCLGSDPR